MIHLVLKPSYDFLVITILATLLIVDPVDPACLIHGPPRRLQPCQICTSWNHTTYEIILTPKKPCVLNLWILSKWTQNCEFYQGYSLGLFAISGIGRNRTFGRPNMGLISPPANLACSIYSMVPLKRTQKLGTVIVLVFL